ncbi:hypothetical protein K469DRAFT_724395 [Zopfia rhizophila CBS 207.26]|uniref:Zona occludens toxin N-terminal domain-containing protein n=1 Tax=Zopfia rhizophila CBS 207.26 TaxID=1314779 RepID=A0A6A6D9J6_9PEZI|nr:hypothetical protein K469DRAFT_724395 [Zopfia rhizophila CBS 207.26]
MDEEDNGAQSDGLDAEIQHAPLISGQVLQEAGEVLPQYGFLGTQATSGVSSLESRIFLNTNVPFSAFICGVQGSGKSHTTSCILENALIPSRHLGHLKNPLSALVFSYGEYSSSAGFNISEAAFLAAPHSSFPLHPSVKKITIMVSPSNPAIKKLYNRIPNVTVIPFKLKPRNFDIGTMLTLMAVNESNAIPLYMAQVTNILRDMATVSEDGFDYQDFKVRLKQCEFNPAQLNMLEMRLGLLESFLDLSNSCPEPRFQPGEVTIMDMSCPFIDANTACILFKIGLKKYLESSSPGKMIVLDEAHKYMLKTPGSKALTDYLLTTIRLQRHFGARVVISTQEPTLLTDLIALCSITIIHRFTSPDWFAALKKHIPISNTGEEKDEIMSRIEKLRTGTALVYASNAVLRRNGDGGLEKGTGRLMSVRVRKRVTADGGQSVVAV